MTFEQTKKLMDYADRQVKRSLAGEKIPCCRGCFHCCREPVYAHLSEVRLLLSKLSDGEREALKVKLIDWRERFTASGMVEDHMPSAFKYRALNLWCPFLINGECSVYEHRPIACRMHIAKESSAGCEKDELRKDQIFAMFPDLSHTLVQMELAALPVGESEIFDNFYMLLCQELFTPGQESHETGSRVVFTKKSETDLEIKIYNEEATAQP